MGVHDPGEPRVWGRAGEEGGANEQEMLALRAEIAQRLAPLCAHMPAPAFEALVRRIALSAWTWEASPASVLGRAPPNASDGAADARSDVGGRSARHGGDIERPLEVSRESGLADGAARPSAQSRDAGHPNPAAHPFENGVHAPSAAALFDGPGEVRARCRALDWASTPLGRVEKWPFALRTAVQMVLSSLLPNAIFWGPDLVQIYNDAFGAVIGAKHPGALGKPTRECWSEVWPITEPIFRRVLAGETCMFEDALYPLERNGVAEDVYLTLSYSPLLDELAQVAGVLVTLLETTQQVEMRRRQAEREHLLHELVAERMRLERIFRGAPTFLAVFRGPEHVFELTNEAFSALVGRRDLVGRPAVAAIPELRAQGIESQLDWVLATGEDFVGREVPVEITSDPGAPPEEHYFDIAYVPLVDPDGTRVGVITHGTDVTAHVLARRELERIARLERAARDVAEASTRARDEVLGIVSHDLRTPLAVIDMAAQALAEGAVPQSLSERESKIIAMIQRSAEAMGRQIRDLLDVASIEAGHLALEAQVEDPAAILARVADLFAAAAHDAGIALELREVRDLPTIRADADRVIQALGNLVTNALKFTDRGGRVTLSAERDMGSVRFAVEDTGAGIPAEELSHVFDRFWQRRRGATRRGTGLGLPIVRGIVEAHGGELSVQSMPDSGSRFSFTIPAAT